MSQYSVTASYGLHTLCTIRTIAICTSHRPPTAVPSSSLSRKAGMPFRPLSEDVALRLLGQ